MFRALLLAWITVVIAFQDLSALAQRSDFYAPRDDLNALGFNEEPFAELLNILILGDSISMGYTRLVADTLKGVVNAKHIPEYGGDTNRGLAKLNRWIGFTEWNVIHLNWGFHDICCRHPDAKVYGLRDQVKGTQSVGLFKYRENLEPLFIELNSNEAQLIWASTTLVPEAEAGRFTGDEVRYSEAAAAIMKKHGILINDLHATSLTPRGAFSTPADVHFAKSGYQVLGAQVVEAIEPFLG